MPCPDLNINDIVRNIMDESETDDPESKDDNCPSSTAYFVVRSKQTIMVL